MIRSQHDAIEEVVGRGPTLLQHDQTIVWNETRLTAEYGFTEGFALTVMVPFRVVSSNTRYLVGGEQVRLTHENIHHRDETLTGFGDPWLLARLSWASEKWSADVRFGVTLPLGRTEEDPFELGDRGLPHEHIQFGTGTVSPVLGLEIYRVYEKWRIGGWAIANPQLYANDHGYRPGDRLSAGLLAATGFGLDRWQFQVGAEMLGELPERWHGRARSDEGNSGRLDVLLSTGASVKIKDTVYLTAQVRVPVFTATGGGQLSYPLFGTVGVRGYFDLIPHTHEPTPGKESPWVARDTRSSPAPSSPISGSLKGRLLR